MIGGENKLVLLTGTAVVAGLCFLMATDVPLGIEGEWVWPRHKLPENGAGWIDRLVPVGIAACLLLGVARLFEPDQLGSRFGVGRYLVLFVAGWIWFDCVQLTTPMLHRNLKPMWVVYDPSISGYFDKAVFQIDDTRKFLREYEELMGEGDVLHVGTHPPGMFLLCRAAIFVCGDAPETNSILRSLVSADALESFRGLEQQVLGLKPRRLTEAEVDSLVLVQLTIKLLALLTIFPMAWIASLIRNADCAWRAACLTITFPAWAVFFPKSDVAFAVTSLSAIAFGWKALTTDRKSVRFACSVAAGLALWVGLLFSLA